MHAINACLGGPTYTWPSFMQLCDQFDAFAQVPPGTCRHDYLAGTGVTLFAFALGQAGTKWKTLPLAMFGAGTLTDKKTATRLETATAHALGAFVFNAGHVWYMANRGQGQWVRIDSLSGVSPAPLSSVWRDGLGVEVVYPSNWEGEGDAVPVPVPTPVLVQSSPVQSPRPPAPVQRQFVQSPRPPAPIQRHFVQPPRPPAPVQRQFVQSPRQPIHSVLQTPVHAMAVRHTPPVPVAYLRIPVRGLGTMRNGLGFMRPW